MQPLKIRAFTLRVFITMRILNLVSFLVLLQLSFMGLVAASSSSSTAATANNKKLVIGVDGGTESIRACCFDATNGKRIGRACAVPYQTRHPHPGWAEQDPHEWYQCLGQAVREAVESIDGERSNEEEEEEEKEDDYEIVAICVDTTCCSVVVLDEHYEPLRPCLLWMDQRAAHQAHEIFDKCRGNPSLKINSHGQGPLSAEWMTPKALWIYQQEPDVWNAAKTICEYQDYINYQLTGVLCASSCNAATRWHWNGEECIKNKEEEDDSSNHHHLPGRPLSLYQALGIPDLAYKLPQKCLPMGSVVGMTTLEATQHLGLSKPIPVVQGGADAFVGMIGLGCIQPGQLCLITGSSHLHCVVTDRATTAPGTWGAYRGAPLPGRNFAEGGQSSTGSLLRWAKTNIMGASATATDLSYAQLDREAEEVAPGSNGLVALETFQGSRTPVTDPFARGALLGLTLAHTRAHVWRALMEAVCFGTRACIDALAAAGHACSEIVIAGGATRSPLWLQMHADVTGKPVLVCENADAPLLGCAILASVGVGIQKSVDEAVSSMVRIARRVEPNNRTSMEYDRLYENIYSTVADSVRPVAHAIRDTDRTTFVKRTAVALSGGMTKVKKRYKVDNVALVEETESEKEIEHAEETKDAETSPENDFSDLEGETSTIISPSLLACDWSQIRDEVIRCLQANASRLHIDIFDGVFLDSPKALTFGPQMVAAIRRSCDLDHSRVVVSGDAPTPSAVVLDLHMCVERPRRYVLPMAEAGGDRFVFQWEAVDSVEDAIELAVEILATGMACGVSINPETDIENLFPLLATNLVDLVDVLAVEPGFGGQVFRSLVLDKIRRLKMWREENMADFDIMVDGGINDETAEEAIDAGANILVSGSYLFNHKSGMKQAIKSLLKRDNSL